MQSSEAISAECGVRTSPPSTKWHARGGTRTARPHRSHGRSVERATRHTHSLYPLSYATDGVAPRRGRRAAGRAWAETSSGQDDERLKTRSIFNAVSGLVSTVTRSRRNGGGGAPNDPALGSAVASPTATSHQTRQHTRYDCIGDARGTQCGALAAALPSLALSLTAWSAPSASRRGLPSASWHGLHGAELTGHVLLV